MGVMRNLRILSAIAVLLGMLAAGALPGVARAHHEPTIALRRGNSHDHADDQRGARTRASGTTHRRTP